MNDSTKSGYMKGFIPFAIAAAVLSLCGGFTAAVPANIVSDWGMDAGNTTWITLAYSLGAAAMAPVMGKLCDVLGRRAMLLLGLGVFGCGQLLIAFLPMGNLPILLACRFVVGVGAATIAPVVMSYIMTEFPAEKMGTGFSIYMLCATGMVIFGPVLGGMVIKALGWRPVQYICFAACALAFVGAMLLVKKSDQPKKGMAGFDYVGTIFVLIFFSMFLSVPTFGQNNGWTALPTLVCIGVFVVSLIGLFLVEKKAKSPILNGKFMARKQFVLPIIILFLTQGLLQSCMTNIIIFVMYTSANSVLSGIATSVMYVGMALGSIVIGPLADKWEPRIVAAASLVFVAAGAALQMTFTATTGLVLFCVALFLIGLGLGGNATIFMKVVLSGVDPAVAGAGSGTYNVFRDMSAPFGVAIFVPMFSGAMGKGVAAAMGAGLDETAAYAQACASAIHSTALVQGICVVAGIVICLMLPKIYSKKKGEAA
ncbi:MAG: MFS transporter [Oscillospiraceae bacterium]